MTPRGSRTGALRRLALTTALVAGLLASLAVLPSYGGGSQPGQAGRGQYRKAYDSAVSLAKAVRAGKADTLQLGNGQHLHLNGLRVGRDGRITWDPKVKNAVSRGTESGPATRDRTTPAQRAAAREAVSRQRATAGPRLRKTYVRRGHHRTPVDRYEMAGACYGLQSMRNHRWLTLDRRDVPWFSAPRLRGASRIFFKATDLGRFLLHGRGHTNLTAHGDRTHMDARPSNAGDWVVHRVRRGVFTFRVPGHGALRQGPRGGAMIASRATRVRLRLAHGGCTPYPEATTNVVGRPFAGVSKFQEVRGYVDAHTHGMAFEFLGGNVHCGKPWDRFGAPYALRDCSDHRTTRGKGALLEAALSGRPTHDPVGWPTFKDWPAPRSLTHEGTYYKWMERAWRAGERLFVNLLVENDQLCRLYPPTNGKHNSCNDMDSVRLQARDMHRFQRYIDAQSGGPGWGWYRIVRSPEQARRVINRGKLAVVMGIETSVPFGCSQKLGVPQCDVSSIERQLDEVRRMGVRQMELVNKFDNALAGVAGDNGTTGPPVNSANFLETGSFWRMATCDPNDPEVHDKDQDPSAPPGPQDALFGKVYDASGAPAQPVPVYPAKHHCNQLGLSDLGRTTIRGLASRHMIFDPDHMSVKARTASLDLIDRLGYHGVVSSHSWSTPDAYPRIYHEGGFITPYAGDSTGFVSKWRRHTGWADPRYYFGFGFGADINGLGAQGDPRPGARRNPVTYPFRGLGGVTVYRQHSGRRVYDINRDGVAQYGLYPDWIQDLSKVAGAQGPAILRDMARGPEAYLQMWERADGIQPNACVNPGLRKRPALFRTLARGTSTWRVLRRAGQPNTRLGTTYTYCTTRGHARVFFSRSGRLTGVRTY